MDRIEKINDLKENGLKVERKQSIVINNFFSIVTIGMVCISILYYTNYIVPAQKQKKLRTQKIIDKQNYLDKRAYQIKLSHKLNNETTNDKNK